MWLERSISGMCNSVISADHLFFCPHTPPPPCPIVFGNYILRLKYLSSSSRSDFVTCTFPMCLNICTLFLLFLLLFHSWCPRFGVLEVVCPALLASPTQLLEEKAQVTLGRQKRPRAVSLSCSPWAELPRPFSQPGKERTEPGSTPVT